MYVYVCFTLSVWFSIYMCAFLFMCACFGDVFIIVKCVLWLLPVCACVLANFGLCECDYNMCAYLFVGCESGHVCVIMSVYECYSVCVF